MAENVIPAGGTVEALALSPDQNLLAWAYGQTIVIWDRQAKQQKISWAGHTGLVASVEFSPDGTLLATASHDETAKIWNVGTGNLIASFQTGKAWSAVFSPDGQKVATAGSHPQIWNAIPVNVAGTQPFSVAFSPDGQMVASAGMDFCVTLSDSITGTQLWQSENMGFWIWGVVFSLDGKLVAAANGAHKIRVWDVETKVARTPDLEGFGPERYLLCFSPNSKFIASGGGGDVRIWNLAEQTVRSLPGAGKVWPTSFTDDSTGLITAAGDQIQLWQLNP